MFNFYKNLAILITGGAGFIGSHIADKLVEYGAKVTIIDNLSSGNYNNLKKIKDKITFIKGDISDKDFCIEISKDQDIIFHLAAFISVPQSLKDPELCHKTNVGGTFNILESARINKIKRVIFSSSAAVYGIKNTACKEDMPADPKSPYGFTKRIGEIYCKQYSLNFNIETVCLRYFNVYGERQNPKGEYAAVVAKFKYLMARNLPITIFGDGLQTRDFVHVSKVVEANLAVGMLPSEQVNGKIFNVGTGININMFELIEILKRDFPNYNSKINLVPARAGDIKHSIADCSKIQALLENL